MRDLQDLCDLYGVTDLGARANLEALAREGKQRGWWSQHADALPEVYAQYIGLEDVADRLEVYEDSVIPGLFQTEAYMRGLFEVSFPPLDPAVAESRIAARLQRQRILRRRDRPVLGVIIEESVLYRAYGGAAVLHDQLSVLLRHSRARSVDIRVIPLSNPTAMVHSFTIISLQGDEELVYTESNDGGYLYSGQVVTGYREVLNYAKNVALRSRDSTATIERALRESDTRT